MRGSFVLCWLSAALALGCGGSSPPSTTSDEIPQIIINPKDGARAAPEPAAATEDVRAQPPEVAPEALASSPVLAASGQLSRSGAVVELSVSPQDATGRFVGSTLDSANFFLESVTASHVDSGDSVPLTLGVTRVDTAAAPLGADGSLVLLFDSSGSMNRNDPGNQGRLAAVAALLDATQSSLMVSVLDFGVGSTPGMHVSRVLQSFTSERALIDTALTKLRSSGGTPLYAAVNDALTLLESEQRKGAVLLLTDGQARGAHAETIARATQLNTPIYVVGLGRNLDFRALRSLSLETGGFFVEAAKSEALADAFRGAGTGISVGNVRVFAAGAANALKPGPHLVKGNVVTRSASGSERVASPFQFTATMAP